MTSRHAARSAILQSVLCFLVLAASVHGAGIETKEPEWPYTPPVRPTEPAVKHGAWIKNPIDAFVLARLEAADLLPNPPADKLTLLRRVTYDLTGMLPTPEERDAFLNDASPDAYEHLVDRLLTSPRFGERWAQHWLDVVRYAETEGFKLDRYRPDAHRYRDYVIRCLNADLPYDRFIREQIAGDELEPDNPEALIATGLYRLHPEESNGSNYRQIRQDILDDVTDVFGVTFLGLTMGCARCHNHKFDPISQKEYYQLQAFFTPIIQHDDLPLVSHEDQERYQRQMATWEKATQPIRTEIDGLLKPIGESLFKESVVVFDAESHEALETPVEKRTPLQQQLALLAGKQINHKYSRMYRRLAPDKRARYEELKKKLADFDAVKPKPLPLAMAVTDVGPEAPPTYRLATGNYLKPREEVQPGFPGCVDRHDPEIGPPADHPRSTGRRTALARWLCRAEHPLTSRVIVNRLWQHHLGVGIVATPNDFGVQGERATHPELLDWLATELVRQGWHMKAIHRLIVTSATYRQASVPELNLASANAAKTDPSDRLLWHTRAQRRDAEAIRDAVLQVSGQLNLRMFGDSEMPALPEAVMQTRYAWYADENPADQNRRSIYVYARRNMHYPLFGVFDLPDRVNSCPSRSTTTTAPQALAMLNGEFTLTQARHLAGALLKQDGANPQALIRTAYLRLFNREPAAAELTAAERFLERQAKLIAAEGTPGRDMLPEPSANGTNVAMAAAVVDLCHALMNSAEFLYVE
jgi:hypothetical protein